MTQSIENVDFHTFFSITSQEWNLEKVYFFLVPWHISDQIQGYSVYEWCIFEKIQKLKKK